MTAFAKLGLKNVSLITADRAYPYTMPKMWKILAKWAFRYADHTVFQLENQGNWYGKKVMKKSVIIPNPFFYDRIIKPCTENREKTIVSVGRFSPEKRYEVLIEAFKKVHEKYNSYRLILYGYGILEAKYNELVKNYDIEDFVDFPGYTSNAIESIKDASVFVLPSLSEGMPNALIEALAVGVPSVSTDGTPGGPDFLTNHGKRGLLVPVNDPESMANEICRIIESDNLSNELSCSGQEIISILDKNVIAEKWRFFFQSL